MYFETDIYSLGIILFELLAGTVPFPLHGRGEMGRNSVMLAHMETAPPDLLALRKEAMPSTWSYDKKEREMQVPAWLLNLIGRCLEKEPSKRFKNGMELQEFIHSGMIAEEHKMVNVSTEQLTIARTNELQLKKLIEQLQLQSLEKDNLIDHLQNEMAAKEKAIEQYQYAESYNSLKPKKSGISKGLFFLVLLVALGLGGFTTYDSLIKPVKASPQDTSVAQQPPTAKPIDTAVAAEDKMLKKPKLRSRKINPTSFNGAGKSQAAKTVNDKGENGNSNAAISKEYKVINRAFFHQTPDEHSRTNVYIIPSDETITATEENAAFIYVTIVDAKGKISKGWILKKDLVRVNDY
jgi:serine/threonine-protein kinase